MELRKLMLHLLYSLIVIGGLVLAACSSQTAQIEPTLSLTFLGDDAFNFSPTEAMASSGDAVEVRFVNQGELEHSWVLIPNSVEALAASEADALANASSGTLLGAEEITFTFQAPAAGTYVFVCTVPGHAAAGMVGALAVSDSVSE